MGKKAVCIKQYLMLGAATVLAAVGMGSSCPGTSSTANFEQPALLSLKPSVTFPRDWTAPMIIDQGAVDPTDPTLASNNNSNSSGGGLLFPGAVFFDVDTNFYALFNHGALPPPATPVTTNMYVTQQIDMYSSSWVVDNGSFTQLDFGMTAPTTNVDRPLVDVDSEGNATAVFLSRRSAGNVQRPVGVRHTFGNGAWGVPADLMQDGVTTQGDVLNSLAISHDAFNQVVAVWIHNSGAGLLPYFNEYRQNLGWRFNAIATTPPNSLRSWIDPSGTLGTTALDLGVDVGFDRYGNGYGVYVSSVAVPTARNVIVTARWRSDKPENFAAGHVDYVEGSQSSATTVHGYPRILVNDDGSANLFWYQSYDGTSSAQLWTAWTQASASPASGSWSKHRRFDLNVGSSSQSVYMRDSNSGFVIPPIVARRGRYQAVAFIKSDGATRRLYVFRSKDGGTFSSLGTADFGGLGRSVEWADIAVNASGEVAIAYSAMDPFDFREHVYGNVYTRDTWTGVTQLDVSTSLDSLAHVSKPLALPKVSIDDLGNVCAVYTSIDTNAVARRRVVANFYR